MTRPEEFFHGTHVSLNPGDIISPRNTTNTESNFDVDTDPNDKTGWNLGSMAYATTGEGGAEGAEWYAKRAAERHGEGRVYKVEPVNPEDVQEDIYGWGKNFTAVQSPSGFRVIGEHKSGVCRNCSTLRETNGSCACPDNS